MSLSSSYEAAKAAYNKAAAAQAAASDALETVRQDLKALNAEVEVDQQEYDEVVAVKALFLNEDYR